MDQASIKSESPAGDALFRSQHNFGDARTRSPESGSASPEAVSSSSPEGKLPSVQQILPNLLGIPGWTIASALGHQSSSQAQNPLARNAQFLLANQALHGLHAQQFLQSLPSPNSAAQQGLLSLAANPGNQQLLAMAGLQQGSGATNHMALMNLQMHQLFNSGLSGNQVLAAINNQLMANAAAVAQGAYSRQTPVNNTTSVIRRAGKPNSSLPVPEIKREDSEDEEMSSEHSEPAGDDEHDEADRGPTIAQLTGAAALSTRATENGQSKASQSRTNGLSDSQAVSSSSSTSFHNKHLRTEKSTTGAGRSSVNIVDGIDLEEIREFAKKFKMRRLSLGLTQTQVGQALSATEGPSYSQSAICRFEKLDITPRSAQKIKPVLERWMKEAEERYENGGPNLAEFVGCEPNKKRKRRTSFTPQALEILNNHFEKNTHPSGSEVTHLADELNYDREVVRVWFCNKRQALKNTIKKIKNSR